MTIKTEVLKSIVRRVVDSPPPKNPNYYPDIMAVVAVSGAAALGKTSLCKNLKAEFELADLSANHIQLDGYLRGRKERVAEGISGYDPRSTRLGPLLEDLQNLIFNGKSIAAPTYDHEIGDSGKTEDIGPKKVLILDGIMSLHYEIRQQFTNLNLFLYAEDLTMRGLRLKVDMEERDYTVFQALHHSDSESRAYDRWIHHQIEFADIKLEVGDDWEIEEKTENVWGA